MVKNPPARAGNVDSIPDLGRPHVQQSSHAREPHLLSCALEPGSCDYGSPYTSNPRSATRDATAVRSRCAKLESRLQAALLGKKPTQQRQPSTAKKINKMGFILGGSKITADGDCSHETKRCLFLGRKAVTNLAY